MTSKSYGLDFLLVYSWDWWQDRVNTGKPTLEEDYKDDERNKAPEPPYTLPNDGPSEFKNTETAGQLKVDDIFFAGIEECPRCQETLHIYEIKDLEGRNIYRCKNCFVKLKRTQVGWVEDKD